MVFCTSVAGTRSVVSCSSSEMGFPLHVYCVTCTFSVGSSSIPPSIFAVLMSYSIMYWIMD